LIGKIGQGTKGGGPLICTGCTYQPIWCSAALDGFSHWLLTENCMRWVDTEQPVQKVSADCYN